MMVVAVLISATERGSKGCAGFANGATEAVACLANWDNLSIVLQLCLGEILKKPKKCIQTVQQLSHNWVA